MAKTRTKTKAPSKTSSMGKIGGGSSTKSTSETPQISITNNSQLKEMLAIISAKKGKVAALAALNVAEEGFEDKATEMFEQRCRDDGTLHTSVRFGGTLKGDPVSLQFTQSRRCKPMDEEVVSDGLHSVFGEDYDKFFKPKRVVTINVDKMTDVQVDETIEFLIDLLGTKEKFDAVVGKKLLVVPKPAFFGKRVLDAQIRVKAQIAKDEGLAEMWASSFKL